MQQGNNRAQLMERKVGSRDRVYRNKGIQDGESCDE
jgi:hypothetical protein